MEIDSQKVGFGLIGLDWIQVCRRDGIHTC